MNNSCEQFGPELAAYALGESPSPELRQHLATCADCQSRLRGDVRVGQALLAGVPAVEPAVNLRAKILAAAERETRLAQRPISRRRPVWRWAAQGAAAVAFLALFGWNVVLQGQLNQQRTEVSASRANWQTMASLLNAEKLVWYPLAGQAARGHFWTSPEQAAACLMVEGLPPLPDGQVYQIWLERGQEATSGGILVAANGKGWKVIRDDNPTSYTSIMVTTEPAGGSSTPTGQPVLAGTLAQASAPTPNEWLRAKAMILADF